MARLQTDWFAVFILFAAGLCAAMQFAKVVPVIEMIGHDLGLGLVASSFAVSILGLVGVAFAITIGRAVNSIGLSRALLFALFGGALFAALGALAPTATLFLVSRFAEGFSHLLIAICAPTLMTAHTTAKDRPIALALWACFFGLGFALNSAAAPLIVPDYGWRNFLLAHAAIMFLIGCLVHIAVKRSGYRNSRSALPNLSEIRAAHFAVIQSKVPLLLALTFCGYTIQFLAILTFLGLFLTNVQQWDQNQVGSYLAFASIITLLFTLGSGFLVRLGVSLFIGLATAFTGLIGTAIGVFILQPQDVLLSILIIVMMACFGLLPGFIFANVPTIASTPVLATLIYGAIALFGNLGTFLGTPLFAISYNIMGWAGGAAFMIAMSMLGLVFAVALNVRIKQPM